MEATNDGQNELRTLKLDRFTPDSGQKNVS
jgi:hypothetical protein